jgi:hypothetical protein
VELWRKVYELEPVSRNAAPDTPSGNDGDGGSETQPHFLPLSELTAARGV